MGWEMGSGLSGDINMVTHPSATSMMMNYRDGNEEGWNSNYVLSGDSLNRQNIMGSTSMSKDGNALRGHAIEMDPTWDPHFDGRSGKHHMDGLNDRGTSFRGDMEPNGSVDEERFSSYRREDQSDAPYDHQENAQEEEENDERASAQNGNPIHGNVDTQGNGGNRKVLTREEKLHEWLEDQIRNQTNIISDALHLIPLCIQNSKQDPLAEEEPIRNNANVETQTEGGGLQERILTKGITPNTHIQGSKLFSFNENISYTLREQEHMNRQMHMLPVPVNDESIEEEADLNKMRNFILTFNQESSMEPVSKTASTSMQRSERFLLSDDEPLNESLFISKDDKQVEGGSTPGEGRNNCAQQEQPGVNSTGTENETNKEGAETNGEPNESTNIYFVKLMKSRLKNPLSIFTGLAKKDAEKEEQPQEQQESAYKDETDAATLPTKEDDTNEFIHTDIRTGKDRFDYKNYLLKMLLQSRTEEKRHLLDNKKWVDHVDISSTNLFMLNIYRIMSDDAVNLY